MFTVAGANLFGQWFADEIVIEGFQKVSKVSEEINFDLDQAKLIQATWSYNIFEQNGTFFISGSFKGKDNQLLPLPLPKDIDKDSMSNLLVAGNDHNLIIVEAEKQVVRVIDLKFVKETKKLNLNTVGPVEEPENVGKKARKVNQVTKVVVTNNACVYLKCLSKTTEIYTGLLPIFFNTERCHGRIIDVQCGYEHYVLLTDTGRVYTWGNGRRLQLGHGDIQNEDKPRELRALSGIKIVKIRAGGWHSAVLSEFGDLYVWGWNDVGQLGVKSKAQRRKEAKEGPSKQKKTYTIPVVVDLYDEEINEVSLDVIDVCCGTKHTAILLDDYSIWATGSNEYGQLGLPTVECSKKEYFVKVYQGSEDTFLRCGPWSTVVIK